MVLLSSSSTAHSWCTNAGSVHSKRVRRPILDFANYIISILISLAVGLLGFIAAYKLFDWLTPGVNFSDQLNADNRSVAIFLAGLFVGLGLLLGNAIK